MKIATWNVNSLRVRLAQVQCWVEEHQPDVLCLQETKLVDEDFPEDDIRALGYEVVYAGQKTYNGVATLSKSAGSEVITELPDFDDPQRRLLGVTVDDVRILNAYIPNGQRVDSEKFQYKLSWLQGLQRLVQSSLTEYPNVVLLGDFNIAPEERDVHDPELWRGKVLFSEPERLAFRYLLEAGLNDSFRKFDQEHGSFSWWDYRSVAFRRNRGLRIDHILCSDAMYELCRSCRVDKVPREHERPSDHAPVVAEFGKLLHVTQPSVTRGRPARSR